METHERDFDLIGFLLTGDKTREDFWEAKEFYIEELGRGICPYKDLNMLIELGTVIKIDPKSLPKNERDALPEKFQSKVRWKLEENFAKEQREMEHESYNTIPPHNLDAKVTKWKQKTLHLNEKVPISESSLETLELIDLNSLKNESGELITNEIMSKSTISKDGTEIIMKKPLMPSKKENEIVETIMNDATADSKDENTKPSKLTNEDITLVKKVINDTLNTPYPQYGGNAIHYNMDKKIHVSKEGDTTVIEVIDENHIASDVKKSESEQVTNEISTGSSMFEVAKSLIDVANEEGKEILQEGCDTHLIEEKVDEQKIQDSVEKFNQISNDIASAEESDPKDIIREKINRLESELKGLGMFDRNRKKELKQEIEELQKKL